MSKNKWFKHYNQTHLGASFSRLRANRDFETMACFWMTLELLSSQESEDNRGFMEIPHRLLHQTWNVNEQRAERIVTNIITNFVETMRIAKLEQTYQVSVSKWLELQETRGGKRKAKTEQKPERSKKEEGRSKKKINKKDPSDLPELAVLWNLHTENLPKVQGCSAKRLAHAKERWSEKPSEQYWVQTIQKINASAFCNGKNDRKWKADFDFFIRPDTHFKVNEGKYDNRGYQEKIISEEEFNRQAFGGGK